MTGKIRMTEQIRHQLTLSPCCDLGWVRDLWLARLVVTQSCWCWVVVAVCARRGSVEDCTALELSAQFRRAVTPHSAQPGQPASALPGSSTRGYIQHTQHSHPDTAPPSPAQVHTPPHHPRVPPTPDHIVHWSSFRDVQISVPTAHARHLARTDGWQHN